MKGSIMSKSGGGHDSGSHGGSRSGASHSDGDKGAQSKGGKSKGAKGGTQVAQSRGVKNGFGIGVGGVDILGNADKASKLPSNNPGPENAVPGMAKRAAKRAMERQAQEKLDNAKSQLGRAKAGRSVERGPR